MKRNFFYAVAIVAIFSINDLAAKLSHSIENKSGHDIQVVLDFHVKAMGLKK